MNNLKLSWFVFIVIIFVTLAGGVAFFLGPNNPNHKAQPVTQTCPANDVIIYPEDVFDKDKAIYCPVGGQQLTVVREPHYKTYIKCSCHE